MNILEPKKQIPDSRKKFNNKDLKKLIVPIIIEQFLAVLVGMIDTLMISYAGEAAISGVSLVNQFNTVFIVVFSALASGGAVVASQYVGCGDKKKGSLAASQLFMITSLIGIILLIVLLVWGGNFFDLLFGKVEADTRSAGIIYLMISAWSYPFLASYNAGAGLYRSMGKTKTIMNVSLVMNGINIVGNAIGVFILKAGVRGVAYPTLISRIFAATAMLILVLKPENQLVVVPKLVFRFDFEMIGRIFKIAIPSSVEGGLFQLSKLAISSMIAGFGTVAIASYGVSQSMWGIGSLFCIGMGPAFITIVGQYMGAGDVEGADYYMKKLLRITFVGAIIWNLVALSLTPVLLLFYNLSPEAKHLVLILVMIHDLFNGIIAPTAFALVYGLQAAGDVVYTMLSAIFSTVIMRTILSYVFGICLGWGVIGTTIAMICDWAIKAILIIARYRSRKWVDKKVINL